MIYCSISIYDRIVPKYTIYIYRSNLYSPRIRFHLPVACSRGQMMYDTDSECGHAAPLTLHYGNHHVYLMAEIQQAGDEHSDMELMCEQGATIRAHSLVLASVSPLVRRLLKEDNVCMYHNLVLQFPEIKESHMKTVLDFIYTGQASVLVSVTVE